MKSVLGNWGHSPEFFFQPDYFEEPAVVQQTDANMHLTEEESWPDSFAESDLNKWLFLQDSIFVPKYAEQPVLPSSLHPKKAVAQKELAEFVVKEAEAANQMAVSSKSSLLEEVFTQEELAELLWPQTETADQTNFLPNSMQAEDLIREPVEFTQEEVHNFLQTTRIKAVAGKKLKYYLEAEIQAATSLYLKGILSYRNVSNLFAQKGVYIPCCTLRDRCQKIIDSR